MPFLMKNRFGSIFSTNSNFKKSLGLKMTNEIFLTNIDSNLIFKRESNLMPSRKVPSFLVDTSLANYTKKETINTMYKNLLKDILDYSSSSPQIHTDATKTNTGVVIAIMYNDSSLSYKLLDHNSIYTVEYKALL